MVASKMILESLNDLNTEFYSILIISNVKAAIIKKGANAPFLIIALVVFSFCLNI